MGNKYVINVDLAKLYLQPDRKEYLHSLAFGDEVEVLDITDSFVRVKTMRFNKEPDGSILPEETEAYICPTKSSGYKPADVILPREENKVLKVNFVDVQQGDGIVIESPDGKIILVDGGDNQLFARYLAARFTGTSKENPKEIDCIVVTHGDVDHFVGLCKINESETNKEPRKQLFIAPKRVYHNGLVKRPDGVPEIQQLGPVKDIDKKTKILTGLVDNLLDFPDKEMNAPFKKWKEVLSTWNQRSPIEFKRLSYGDEDAFKFFESDELKISVLGPVMTETDGVKGLQFLHKPPETVRSIGDESPDFNTDKFKGFSPSHTINGHSVVFKLKYGAVSFLFCGDMNEESECLLAAKLPQKETALRSEVFKVGHHGSSEFSGGFMKIVSPVVSVISSGDESLEKEYIHPRATLVGALGHCSRIPEPLIFITELVAFFKTEGKAHLVYEKEKSERGNFFAFSRAAYGIVKTRTDGKRLLVYTDSGKVDMKEAYSYCIEPDGAVKAIPVIKV